MEVREEMQTVRTGEKEEPVGEVGFNANVYRIYRMFIELGP